MTPVSGRFYRCEAAEPDGDGRRSGMFGMLRDLRRSGRLEAADEDAAASLVARAYALHAEPPASAYPADALSWFVADGAGGAALAGLTADVAALLARHDRPTRLVWTDDPGRITFRDAVQVVAAAHPPDGADGTIVARP